MYFWHGCQEVRFVEPKQPWLPIWYIWAFPSIWEIGSLTSTSWLWASPLYPETENISKHLPSLFSAVYITSFCCYCYCAIHLWLKFCPNSLSVQLLPLLSVDDVWKSQVKAISFVFFQIPCTLMRVASSVKVRLRVIKWSREEWWSLFAGSQYSGKNYRGFELMKWSWLPLSFAYLD